MPLKIIRIMRTRLITSKRLILWSTISNRIAFQLVNLLNTTDLGVTLEIQTARVIRIRLLKLQNQQISPNCIQLLKKEAAVLWYQITQLTLIYMQAYSEKLLDINQLTTKAPKWRPVHNRIRWSPMYFFIRRALSQLSPSPEHV